VWSILWLIFVSETPEHQKMISAEEKNYILDKTAEHILRDHHKKV
jgi:hypothetical protein